MPKENNEIPLIVKYLGEDKEIKRQNVVLIRLNNSEMEKLIKTCNQHQLTISQIIRQQSQPCSLCSNTSVTYFDKETNTSKTFERVTFLAKRIRSYFKKREGSHD